MMVRQVVGDKLRCHLWLIWLGLTILCTGVTTLLLMLSVPLILGFGGQDVIEGNLLANCVRESGGKDGVSCKCDFFGAGK